MKKGIRVAAALVAALAINAANAAAPESMQALLLQNASKPLVLTESDMTVNGKISAVGSDYFCASFAVKEQEVVHCFPFSAVRFVVPKGVGPERISISVR